ncbi:hypothetical protein OJAV_G00231970 [Oryzias javanicus]|uniref:Mitochondrial fission regulator n=1 Tax=Oryzias javanicus TaxID=123683 RepID=A0A3S2NPA2_ORYJA|nr:hypothetical protein OJAV_G00231970 [Oryzias javanicus]
MYITQSYLLKVSYLGSEAVCDAKKYKFGALYFSLCDWSRQLYITPYYWLLISLPQPEPITRDLTAAALFDFSALHPERVSKEKYCKFSFSSISDWKLQLYIYNFTRKQQNGTDYDFVHVLRTVLEYFGVPPDMLDPVWTSQLCGQYRSIIRMIGSNLPLKPPPRIHFQIPLIANMPHEYVDATVDTPAIPSLADIMWVFEDKGDSFAKTRMHLPPKKPIVINQNQNDSKPNVNSVQKRESSAERAADPETLKKISALESELLKLRAQIAMIVTTTQAADHIESQNAPLVPLTSPPPLPFLTSTPRPVPPPPPPPPPPCLSSSTDTLNVMELIRQNRKNKTVNGQLQPQNSENKAMPSMMDVLKNLNQVKLRSVQRSPGGTPVRRRRSKGGASVLSDPAALIAEALKRKFAQHRHNTSSDKENSQELSPFGSPESPKVSVHFRRSQGRRHF